MRHCCFHGIQPPFGPSTAVSRDGLVESCTCQLVIITVQLRGGGGGSTTGGPAQPRGQPRGRGAPALHCHVTVSRDGDHVMTAGGARPLCLVYLVGILLRFPAFPSCSYFLDLSHHWTPCSSFSVLASLFVKHFFICCLTPDAEDDAERL